MNADIASKSTHGSPPVPSTSKSTEAGQQSKDKGDDSAAYSANVEQSWDDEGDQQTAEGESTQPLDFEKDQQFGEFTKLSLSDDDPTSRSTVSLACLDRMTEQTSPPPGVRNHRSRRTTDLKTPPPLRLTRRLSGVLRPLLHLVTSNLGG